MSSQTGVYVIDKKYGWLAASVISYDGNTASVSVEVPTGDGEESTSKENRTVKLKEYEDGALPLQNVDEGGHLIEMADMCDLPSLHEAAILYNLKARHQNMNPYTRVGDIVIAMNPFQWMEHLYSEKTRELYVEKLITNVDTTGDAKSGLDPHVYETSSLAYRGLAVDGQHQAILVSGESGAGKTETVKIVMSHLASVQSLGDERGQASNNQRSNPVVRRVLDSNPLLEAFGNAKTVRNDNSSRFGKYIQLQFDVEDATAAAFSGRAIPSCILAGSTCETYLLEKSRVVGHEASERTYHIFYQLIGAPESTKTDIWDALVGTTNSSFRYVGETDTTVIEGMTDGERYQRTVDALALVGIHSEKLKTLMRAICTVMQLGNLTFDIDPENDDGSVISSLDELKKLAELMGVENDDIKKALTFRTVVAAKESYSVPLKVGMARDGCDGFAKEIYQQTFDWLVRNINEATSAEANYGDASDVDQYGTIGLLDIFGFESFKVNRFEQLCINYANEKLQQKYNIDIFRSVQDEYEYEGIEMADISFTDNSNVLNLIEGRMGLISVLNEECVRPNGNDNSFVSKMKTVNKELECLVQNPLHRASEFAISHYAGPVQYDATNFVQKNTDNVPKDVVECACKSSNDLIRTELKAAAEAKAVAPVGRGRAGGLTVSTKFRNQLHKLMTNIGKTRTRYIRCIKPNPEKVPLKVNLLSSVEQLRCAGVVAAVSISRVAYPNRLIHQTALDRFRCLYSKELSIDGEEKKDEGNGENSDLKLAVISLMTELLHNFKVLNKNGETVSPFACGKSRVYFKAGALELLESKRMAKLGVLAIAIQRIVRGFTAKSIYMRLKDTSISVQALARRNLARARLLQACKAVTSMSCWIRCLFAKRELIRRRRERACIMLQTRCRIRQAQKLLKKCQFAAISIQRIARGSRQRPIYRAMQEEAREEARVNSKLAALQKRLADAEMKWMKADKARIEAEKRVASGEAPALVKEDDAETSEEKKDEQITLLDESTEMLDYLKKQVFELRSKNFLLRSDLNEMKNSNQQLTEHHKSLTSSFEALKQHATQLSQANMKLIVQGSDSKRDLTHAKKELTVANFKHQSEVGKLKDLMKAKDEDNAKEIARMKAEIERLQRNNTRGPSPSLKGPQAKERADFGRKSPNPNFFSQTEFVDAEDDWGHDGFLSTYGSSKRPSPRGLPRQNRRWSNSSSKNVTRSSAINTGTSLGKRITSSKASSAEPPKSSLTARSSLGAAASIKKSPSSLSMASSTKSRTPASTPPLSRNNSRNHLPSATTKNSSLAKATSSLAAKARGGK